MAGCWCVQVIKSWQKKLYLEEVWVVSQPSDELKKELTQLNGQTIVAAKVEALALQMTICQNMPKLALMLLSSQRWDNVVTLVYKPQ